jgi:hypothetical protein
MGKRYISAEERERRRQYQRSYRAKKSQSDEWRQKESERKLVCILHFDILLTPVIRVIY